MEQQLSPQQRELLKKDIQELLFSNEFKFLMKQLSFQNLEQLSKYRIEELENMEGFHTLLIHEYGGFMVSNNLGELIDP